MDNEGGSGLYKISKGGGPDSYHASIEGFDFIKDLPEDEWQNYDKMKMLLSQSMVEHWQKENYTLEFERLQGLKKMIREGALYKK